MRKSLFATLLAIAALPACKSHSNDRKVINQLEVIR